MKSQQEAPPSPASSSVSLDSASSSRHSSAGGGDCREETSETMKAFHVQVSRRFISLTLFGSMLIAFMMGRTTRIIFLKALHEGLIEGTAESRNNNALETVLVLDDDHKLYHTRYSSKNFDTGRSVLMSSWPVTNRHRQRVVDRDDDVLASDQQNQSEVCREAHRTEDDGAIAGSSTEKEPAAEHLMVDIKNVDGAFLNSEVRLAHAIVDLVKEADLPLLSYHCHGFSPVGVSCVGILLRSYLAFHTWPEDGVITFDLVTEESTSILPLLSMIERLFGVPSVTSSGKKPELCWAYKVRGFHHNPTEISNLFQVTDLGSSMLSILGTDLKEKVVSVETDFQRIDIYDIIFPHEGSLESYKKSLSSDDSYEVRNPFLFRPDQVLTLDGWLQSSLFFEAVYHEALVHPALFAHPNPKRVAVIGGGEGATLREVLKHNTVEDAIMIEIDEMLVNVSRDHIPEWSDCSDLVGSSSWCIDDPRAKLYYEDAFQWFMERFSSDGSQQAESIDVIILDALDPESDVPFARALYGNEQFMRAFYNSLSEDGILVMQLGQAPTFDSPDETHSKFRNRAATIRLLEDLGFGSIHEYEEANCGFFAPWAYVIGLKSHETRDRWYANAARIETEIRKRSLPTKSGTSPFCFFDGSTMAAYQVPHHATEVVYCRRRPTPKECEGVDVDSASALDITLDTCDDTEPFKFSPVLDRRILRKDIHSTLDIVNVVKEKLIHQDE